MWTLARLFLDKELFKTALSDPDPSVRRNAALICEATGTPGAAQLVADADAAVRLAALRALGAGEVSAVDAKSLVAAWPKFDDDFQRSAAVGAASRNAGASLAAAFEEGAAPDLAPLVSVLAQTVGGADAANLVVLLAGKPARFDALKGVALGALAKSTQAAPEMSGALHAALGKLLAGSCSKSALPLVAKWDQGGHFEQELARITRALLASLSNAGAGDGERIAAARALVGLVGTDKNLMAMLLQQLAAKNTASFEREFIGVLSETGDLSVGAALVAGFAQLPAETQASAFEAIVKRADWVTALLDALQAKQLPLSLFNASACSRLRTHPNRAVAARAAKLIDELNPGAKLKKELIAKLAPLVEQPGDVEKGKATFASTCAVCHSFGGAGADIGPALTGMGTHGAGELLAAIVDPNAEVDPSFRQWNIETRDGNSFAGVIAAENPATLTLKSLAGVQQVKVSDIKSRVDTGLSLMPEGFGGLPPEMLRDIIAYMQSGDGGRFRVVDLKSAFTVDSRQLPVANQGQKTQPLVFDKFGAVNVGEVPFQVVDSRKNSAGKNLLMLKGGPADSLARQLPVRVEVALGGFKANRLHFMGGVAGWAGAASPVLKVTVVYADAKTEEFTCQNGVEFADFSSRVEVPGSKFVELVKERQVRYFARDLQRAAPIDKLILESAGEGGAITVGITAELAEPAGKGAAVKPSAKQDPAPAGGPEFVPQFNDPVSQPPATANGPRVLLVGGGASHDFLKYFGGSDKATLAPVVGWVEYTQNANGIAGILDRVDVLVWSANQPISAGTAKALEDYVNRGGSVVALHPGNWQLWKNFPQWNSAIIGGGARGHDPLGAFRAKVSDPNHPVVKGVPAEFEITDELYHFKPEGPALEVLVSATSAKTGTEFPQVFVVKHPKAKIAGITFGHDARAHDLPAYQTLLRNAVLWAAQAK